MADTKYTKSYSILGVFQDDDWEMIRAAYRRQIKRWHPDRLQDPQHRKIAEEKSKEINQAYQNLTSYYREFGVLPPDRDPEETVTPTTQEKWTVPEQPDHPETDRASFEDSSEDSPQPARRHYAFRFVLAGIVIAIVYAFYEPSFLDHQGTDELYMHGNPGNRPANDQYTTKQYGHDKASIPGVPSTAVIPDNTTSTHSNHWINDKRDTSYDFNSRSHVDRKNTQASSDGRKPAFNANPRSPAVTLRPAFIVKGSSKSEVLALQGSPLRQTDTEWDYGLSRIYFQNGKVIGWYENPMNPLIVAR